MPPAGKWIRKLEGAMPVDQGAKLALEDRLAELPRLLSRAATGKPGSKANVRRVHQLRVATRRAGAAIRVFEDVLKPKQVKRWKRWLRRIRRTAGTVRDMDIAADRLASEHGRSRGPEARAATRCQEAMWAVRAAAYPKLERLADKLPVERMQRATSRLIGTIDGAAVAESSAVSFARRVLRRELDEVKLAAGRDLSGNINDVHALRIAIKRLRYAMELFGFCFEELFRQKLYSELTGLQDHLGQLNDLAGLSAHIAFTLREGARRKRPRQKSRSRGSVAKKDREAAGEARLLKRYASRLPAAQAAFVEQWQRFKPQDYFERFEGALRPRFTAQTIVESKLRPRPEIRRDPSGPVALNGHAPKNRRSSDRRRIAAIDVGTNSLRLIIAEAALDGSYRVLDDEKEVTRLGRGLQATGKLDAPAIEHSVAAIARMKSIAEGYGVEQLRIVATAAAREAENSDVFREAVFRATGIQLEIIPAEQEALLAYRSAARAFDLSSLVSAVVDIGGGSTEVVLSIGGEAAATRVREAVARAGSTLPDPTDSHTSRSRHGSGGMIERLYTIPLGAVRLTERFGGPELCSGERYKEMRRFVKRVVNQHVRRVPAAPQLLVGTGGTFTTLGAMALQRELGASVNSLFAGVVQGHEVARSEVRHLLEYLRKLPVKDRARVPGLSADRADIIVAGLLIIDVILRRLDVNRARIHEGGIRDGILLSMIGERLSVRDETTSAADPITSARRFARACAYEESHSNHVAHLSMAIFDQLQAQLPQWPVEGIELSRARQILEAAAILHDIGYLINYTAHHKHSYHLIVHADLPGWTSREINVIANIARYHRCAAPHRKHAAFATLARSDQQLVRALAGILRIADGLDRTHVQAVRDVAITVRDDAAFIEVAAAQEPSVDLWGGARKGRLFQRTFGLTPHFEWRRKPHEVIPGREAVLETTAAA